MACAASSRVQLNRRTSLEKNPSSDEARAVGRLGRTYLLKSMGLGDTVLFSVPMKFQHLQTVNLRCREGLILTWLQSLWLSKLFGPSVLTVSSIGFKLSFFACVVLNLIGAFFYPWLPAALEAATIAFAAVFTIITLTWALCLFDPFLLAVVHDTFECWYLSLLPSAGVGMLGYGVSLGSPIQAALEIFMQNFMSLIFWLALLHSDAVVLFNGGRSRFGKGDVRHEALC